MTERESQSFVEKIFIFLSYHGIDIKTREEASVFSCLQWLDMV